jgi:sugar/nucleoside kinase (ribokinase family)
MGTIVVVGSVATDDVVTLTQPMRPGAHLDGASAGERLGGGGANTAVALAAAGHHVVLVAEVGDDAAGAARLEQLSAAGVDISQVARIAQPSTRSLVLLDPDGERTIVNLRRTRAPEPPMRLCAIAADCVYVRSSRLDLAPLLSATTARSLVVVHAPPWAAGARPAHIVVASAADGSPGDIADPFTAGRRLAGESVRWVVITRGAAGAVAHGRERRIAAAAPTVQPVDSTGAGDAFAAGLIHALTRGAPMAEALAIAARWGAEATQWRSSALPPAAMARLLQ